MDRSSPSPQREAALPPARAAASAMPPPVAVAFPSVLHQLSIEPLPPLPVAVASHGASALLDAGVRVPPFTPVASADAGGFLPGQLAAPSWAASGAGDEAEEPTTPREEAAQLRTPTSPPRAAAFRPPPPDEAVSDEEAARSAARRRRLLDAWD